MKINNIITLSLSLVLAPALNAQTEMADTAARCARLATFQFSRFQAGRWADALCKKGISKLLGGKLPDSIIASLLPLSGLAVTGVLTPKALNKITSDYCPRQLSWLAPQHEAKKSLLSQGTIAFCAGMVSTRYFDW